MPARRAMTDQAGDFWKGAGLRVVPGGGYAPCVARLERRSGPLLVCECGPWGRSCSEELDSVGYAVSHFLEGLDKRLLNFVIRALATRRNTDSDTVLGGKCQPNAARLCDLLAATLTNPVSRCFASQGAVRSLARYISLAGFVFELHAQTSIRSQLQKSCTLLAIRRRTSSKAVRIACSTS